MSRIARLLVWLATALLAGAVGILVLNIAAPAIPSAQLERDQGALARLQSLPVQAQSVISTAVGSDTPVFAPTRTAAGFTSAGGGVSAAFTAAAVTLRSRGGSVSFGAPVLNGGGPTDLRSIGTRANRVVYDRGGLAEWYATGPLGIEQGFAVAHRPASAGGELSVTIPLGGTLQAETVGSEALFLNASGEVALRYGGLVATDARGRALPARLSVSDGKLALSVADAHATYPITIDPFVQQGPAVTPSDEAAPYGHYGSAVAISADGNTILVGGDEDGNTEPASTGNDIGGVGAAFVFTRTNGVWQQQGPKLVGNSGSPGAEGFGTSVSLSADGNTALIGARDGDYVSFGAGKTGIGSAYVFARSGTAWTRQTIIQPVNPTQSYGSGLNGGFGGEVALSADGTTALVTGDDGSGDGQLWVFERSGASWSSFDQQGTDPYQPTGIGAHGVTAAALSSDGSTALIGSFGVPAGGGFGSAWVFTRSGSSWSQQGPALAPTDASGSDFFGDSAALSGDGNTALVGAPLDGGSASQAGVVLGPGAAFVFTRSGGTWGQQAKLTGAGGQAVGTFVGLSSSGNIAAAGGSVVSAGVAGIYEWDRSGSSWTAQAPSPIAGATEFSDAAMSGDSNTAVAGDGTAGNGIGTARVLIRRFPEISGKVSGAQCTEQSCSQTPLEGIDVLVKGTALNGAAVSVTDTTAADGTWSVTVPSGTYKAGPTSDGTTPGDLSAFDPESLPVTVSGADVANQNFSTCALGAVQASARSAAASVPGAASDTAAAQRVVADAASGPTATPCRSIYTVKVSAKIPQEHLVDPSTKAAYEVEKGGGYNPTTRNSHAFSPGFPACFTAAQVEKYTKDGASAEWYTDIKGGPLGSASASFAWDRKAQEVHVVSGPTVSVQKLTRVFHYKLQDHGKTIEKTCPETNHVQMLTLPVGGSDLPGAGLSGREFALITVWGFPFNPVGERVDPTTLASRTSDLAVRLYGYVKAFDKAVEESFGEIPGYKRLNRFVRFGIEFGASYALGSGIVAAVAKSPALAAKFFEGAKYLPQLISGLEAAETLAHGAHHLKSLQELIAYIAGFMAKGEYPVMGAIIRGRFLVSGYKQDNKDQIPLDSMLALSVKTTKFPTISLQVSRNAEANVDPTNPVTTGPLPWKSLASRQLNIINKLSSNPENVLVDGAAKKFGDGLEGVEAVHKATQQLPELTKAVEEHDEEGTAFGAELGETELPNCEPFTALPEVGTSICYKFNDGRP